jgi:hypothetical protein
VDRVLPLGLVERKLVPLACEVVRTVLDSVRPGDQLLPPAARGDLVRLVTVDESAVAGDVRTEAGADLDDDRPLVSELKLDLLPGRSDPGSRRDQVRMPRQTIRAIQRAPAIFAGVWLWKRLRPWRRSFLICTRSGRHLGRPHQAADDPEDR